MQIRILIVEDESIIAEDMSQMLKKLGYTISGTAYSYNEAIQLLNKNETDLVLVDINLSDSKDGIDLAEQINKHYNLPLIFVTSSADPITLNKAKKTVSNGYVLKPFTSDDLYAAIEMAISNFQTKEVNQQKLKDALFIKDDELFVKVLTNEILWLKSDKNYTEVNTPNKQYVVRGSIKETLGELDNRFIRIHKSYVVNLNKIEALGASYVFINKTEIPIGKNYKDELIGKINMLK